MPTATFAANGSNLLDLFQPNYHNPYNRIVGVYYLGGSKTALYRTLLQFGVFGAAAEGRALTAADVVQAAELEWNVGTVVGPLLAVEQPHARVIRHEQRGTGGMQHGAQAIDDLLIRLRRIVRQKRFQLLGRRRQTD